MAFLGARRDQGSLIEVLVRGRGQGQETSSGVRLAWRVQGTWIEDLGTLIGDRGSWSEGRGIDRGKGGQLEDQHIQERRVIWDDLHHRGRSDLREDRVLEGASGDR